jgi:hypothetical protein
MANHQRDGGKEQLWRDVLERQAASGMSVRKFCQRQRLTESNFCAWRRTICERDSEAISAAETPVFVPAMISGESQHDTDQHQILLHFARTKSPIARVP